MVRPLILPPSSPRRRRARAAAALCCGLAFSAGGCASARRTVARPVMTVIRAVPGVRSLAPEPRPPAPSPPPPSFQAAPEPSGGWDVGPTPAPPRAVAPAPAPRPVPPGRSGGPTLIAPPPLDFSPSERRAKPRPVAPRPVAPRPVAPRPVAPDASDAVEPPPAPAPPADPEAYYPVGEGRNPLAALWRSLSNFGLRPDAPAAKRTAPAAGAAGQTRLVSHEVAAADARPAAAARPAAPRRPAAPSAFAAPLIRLGRPVFEEPAAVWAPEEPAAMDPWGGLGADR